MAKYEAEEEGDQTKDCNRVSKSNLVDEFGRQMIKYEYTPKPQEFMPNTKAKMFIVGENHAEPKGVIKCQELINSDQKYYLLMEWDEETTKVNLEAAKILKKITDQKSTQEYPHPSEIYNQLTPEDQKTFDARFDKDIISQKGTKWNDGGRRILLWNLISTVGVHCISIDPLLKNGLDPKSEDGIKERDMAMINIISTFLKSLVDSNEECVVVALIGNLHLHVLSKAFPNAKIIMC